MPIVKSEAFVLKSFKYGETSKIVTVFTKDLGKMNAIVKGSRNFKSKNCGTLETMNYINSVIYIKDNRELQLISHAEYIKSFRNILKDFEKLQKALRIIDILNKSLPDGEINQPVFDLLIRTYERLNDATENYSFHVLYFLIRLTFILGLSPDLSIINRSRETFFDHNEFNVDENKLEYTVNLISTEEDQKLLYQQLDPDMMTKLSDSYERYLLMHIQGNKFHKSIKVFQELSK